MKKFFYNCFFTILLSLICTSCFQVRNIFFDKQISNGNFYGRQRFVTVSIDENFTLEEFSEIVKALDFWERGSNDMFVWIIDLPNKKTPTIGNKYIKFSKLNPHDVEWYYYVNGTNLIAFVDYNSDTIGISADNVKIHKLDMSVVVANSFGAIFGIDKHHNSGIMKQYITSDTRLCFTKSDNEVISKKLGISVNETCK